MNASIQGIIDHMFKDTIVNAETRALHEELLNNCMEHYDDLIGRGMSEIEAIDAVVDSLKGMKEVIDEYPKKAGAADETKAEDENRDNPVIQVKNENDEQKKNEKPAEYCYDPKTVRLIRAELKGCDLRVGTSHDNRIHVRCEDMDQLICSQDKSVLSIRIADRMKESLSEAGKEINQSEFTLKGLLNFIGKAIGTAASAITVSWNVYIDLPAEVPEEMDISTKSGDVKIRACLPDRLTVHTMSGDAEIESQNSPSKVSVSSMSGEIDYSGNASMIAMNSMSGDVTLHGDYTEAELKSTSGDLKLVGTANRVRMHTVSGDATAEMKDTSVRTIELKTTSGDAEADLAAGTESVHATLSTVSGSARCNFPDSGPQARLQITASSVSGDVTVR